MGEFLGESGCERVCEHVDRFALPAPARCGEWSCFHKAVPLAQGDGPLWEETP